MAYRIVTDPQVRSQIRSLPVDVLHLLADAMGVLELTPWNGRPYNEIDPDGWMRQLEFAEGRGFITYLVLDKPSRRAERNLARVASPSGHADTRPTHALPSPIIEKCQQLTADTKRLRTLTPQRIATIDRQRQVSTEVEF